MRLVIEAAASTSAGLNWATLAPVYAAVVAGVFAAGVYLLQRWDKAKADKEAAEADQRQRRRELALKIVESIAKENESISEERDENGKSTARAQRRQGTMARRFAIGLLKIERVGVQIAANSDNKTRTFTESKENSVKGKAFFIPIYTRVSLGRDENNDIHLYDQTLDHDNNRVLSRHQCGFVATQDDVSLEDYYSTNGTLVFSPDGKETLRMVKESGGAEEKRVVRIKNSQRRLKDGDLILVGPFLLRFIKLEPTW
jgi:hypothetical protein